MWVLVCLTSLQLTELWGPGQIRRRQSNRDSARRTRQRKLTEVKELQERVTGLTHDKTQLLLQHQELRGSYQRMANHLSQLSTEHECAPSPGPGPFPHCIVVLTRQPCRLGGRSKC